MVRVRVQYRVRGRVLNIFSLVFDALWDDVNEESTNKRFIAVAKVKLEFGLGSGSGLGST
jgi:hypothetical protein